MTRRLTTFCDCCGSITDDENAYTFALHPMVPGEDRESLDYDFCPKCRALIMDFFKDMGGPKPEVYIQRGDALREGDIPIIHTEELRRDPLTTYPGYRIS